MTIQTFGFEVQMFRFEHREALSSLTRVRIMGTLLSIPPGAAGDPDR